MKRHCTDLRQRVHELRKAGKISVDFEDGEGPCECAIKFKIGADGAAINSMLGGAGFAGRKEAESCLFCRCPANKFHSEEEFDPKTMEYRCTSAHMPFRGQLVPVRVPTLRCPLRITAGLQCRRGADWKASKRIRAEPRRLQAQGGAALRYRHRGHRPVRAPHATGRCTAPVDSRHRMVREGQGPSDEDHAAPARQVQCMAGCRITPVLVFWT